jgi:hypothetical protein
LIDESSSSALLLARVDADPPQNGWEEVIATVDLKSQIIIPLSDS